MSQYTKSSLFLLVLTRIWKLPEWSTVIYHFAATFLLNRIFSWTGKGGIIINALNFFDSLPNYETNYHLIFIVLRIRILKKALE